MTSVYTDESRCISNDVIEIYKVLGIEAARTYLIESITDVVAHEGEYINNRHIELLCDAMTSRGILIPVNRQGVNTGDVGPLARSSFENTTDQLIKASIFSETDHLSGVSSNIMLGQQIKAGTGLSDIFLDETHLMEMLSSKASDDHDYGLLDEHSVEGYMMGEERNGDGCDLDDFRFSFE